jgi:hypothetical protein
MLRAITARKYERVRTSLTTAMAFAEGQDEKLRLVVAAALASELFDCFLKIVAPPVLQQRDATLTGIEYIRDELERSGRKVSDRDARELRAVGKLRNGFGHWNDLDRKIEEAAKLLDGRGNLRPALQRSAQTVATWLFTDQPSRTIVEKIANAIVGGA